MNEYNEQVDILLATYNGEDFLAEQLDSLFYQTYKNIKIYIRDDGSNDKTLDIIENYKNRYTNLIEIVPRGQRLGAAMNFSVLLNYASSPYIMFCDQDDVWNQDKVQLTLSAMKRLEAIHGTNTPILVHTDLQVVDQNLYVLSNSFWKYQRLNPKFNSLNRLLVRNIITGCSTMINRALATTSIPIPHGVIMHDWWLGLVASTFGKVETLNKTTIKYRQHNKNDIGAKKWNNIYILNKVASIKTIKSSVQRRQFQAGTFLRVYQKQLSPGQKSLLYNFSNINNFKRLKRVKFIVQNSLFEIGLLRNLSFIFAICTQSSLKL